MSSHALAATLTAGNYVFSLAPYPSTQTYAAGYIKLTCSANSGTPGAIIVKPVVATSAPTPGAITASLNAVSDVLIMSTDHNPVVEIGHPFARGFSAEAQGSPVANYLQVTVSAACDLTIQVD